MALQVNKFYFIHKQEIFVRCMSTKISNYDYQYIQKSKVPTMHFQKSLPRLPIPKLEDTCQRYLAAQRPLLDDAQFERTKNNVDRFRSAEGDVLQNLLQVKDKKNKDTSYISKPWFDMYLSDRTSLPINYNPAIIFQNFQKENYNKQLVKATNMLISSLRFMKSLRKNILEPEVFHLNAAKSDTKFFRQLTSLLPSSISWYGAYMFNAYPLDMSQYHRLFNSTRIPEIGKDRLYQNTEAPHILVMRNGNFYIMDVLDKAGNILPAEVLMAGLKCVLEDKSSPADLPLGVLTTENRDVWANARKHIKSLNNERFFEKIDSALFNLILDDTVLGKNEKDITRFFLHSDGKNR